MQRYINADKVHEFVDAKVAEGKGEWAKGVPYEWAYALTVIDNLPAADVVSKDVYDISQHLLGDAWKNIEQLGELCEKLQKSKSAIASEIFEEIDVLFERFINDVSYSSGDLIYDVGELKEKYTEGGEG